MNFFKLFKIYSNNMINKIRPKFADKYKIPNLHLALFTSSAILTGGLVLRFFHNLKKNSGIDYKIMRNYGQAQMIKQFGNANYNRINEIEMNCIDMLEEKLAVLTTKDLNDPKIKKSMQNVILFLGFIYLDVGLILVKKLNDYEGGLPKLEKALQYTSILKENRSFEEVPIILAIATSKPSQNTQQKNSLIDSLEFFTEEKQQKIENNFFVKEKYDQDEKLNMLKAAYCLSFEKQLFVNEDPVDYKVIDKIIEDRVNTLPQEIVYNQNLLLFRPFPKNEKINIEKLQLEICGLIYKNYLVNNRDPKKELFWVEKMRSHLKKCFTTEDIAYSNVEIAYAKCLIKNKRKNDAKKVIEDLYIESNKVIKNNPNLTENFDAVEKLL